MFFVAIGVILGTPALINVANRMLEEVVIPRQELTKLKKRRAAQEAAGVPEEECETTQRIPIDEMLRANERLSTVARDIEITAEEFYKLRESGALDIIRRAANRRAYIKQQEEREAERKRAA